MSGSYRLRFLAHLALLKATKRTSLASWISLRYSHCCCCYSLNSDYREKSKPELAPNASTMAAAKMVASESVTRSFQLQRPGEDTRVYLKLHNSTSCWGGETSREIG